MSRRGEKRGWCCQEVVLVGAQAQAIFLIDMTRHHESTGTQYTGTWTTKNVMNDTHHVVFPFSANMVLK